MRAIAAKGGVVQVTFYDYFLKDTGGATIEDAVRHLLHVIAVAGVEHTGIGTDFDGDGGVPGIRNAADCIHLTQRLLEAGLTAADLRLIWGENFLRVMEQVQRR
ncbi:Peptidase M19, renal dipeptidase [gut metagenome]|uniref:Peptidase M19, renal dipeptidase n=1 Tax=gut metagenome TaxID=749906 RepID=J9GIX0_9ZZZZ